MQCWPWDLRRNGSQAAIILNRAGVKAIQKLLVRREWLLTAAKKIGTSDSSKWFFKHVKTKHCSLWLSSWIVEKPLVHSINSAGLFALRKHTAPLDSHMASPDDVSKREISRMGTLSSVVLLLSCLSFHDCLENFVNLTWTTWLLRTSMAGYWWTTWWLFSFHPAWERWCWLFCTGGRFSGFQTPTSSFVDVPEIRASCAGQPRCDWRFGIHRGFCGNSHRTRLGWKGVVFQCCWSRPWSHYFHTPWRTMIFFNMRIHG